MELQTLPSPAPAASALDPEPIMRIASGFMAAKHLFVASEIGTFAALADGPLALDALAAAISVPARTTRISADAMVALGLLERDSDGRYANSAVTAHFLAGRSTADLRPFLRFWDRISLPAWSGLEQTIRNGSGHAMSLDAQQNDIFAAGVEAITAGAAHALAAVPELGSARRLLDLAGGTGSFLIAALQAHPQLTGTVWELPDTAKIAQTRLQAASLSTRAQALAGDALADPVPPSHDAILVANFLHLLPPEQNRKLLRQLREASDDHTLLLLVDFWTDETRTSPAFAALLAGEFLLVGGQGDVYSIDEVQTWLDATGWSSVEHRPLAGPQTLMIARA